MKIRRSQFDYLSIDKTHGLSPLMAINVSTKCLIWFHMFITELNSNNETVMNIEHRIRTNNNTVLTYKSWKDVTKAY